MTAAVPLSTSFEYVGDGITRAFEFPLRFLENGEVAVLLNDAPRALGTHYVIEGAGAPGGGFVTFEEADVPAPGARVRLERATAPKQTIDFEDSTRTPGNTLEIQLDRMAMVLQDILTQSPGFRFGADNTLALWRDGRLVPGPSWGDGLGIPGPGVAAGGSIGQFLVKVSGVDYETSWRTLDFADVGMGSLTTITTPAAADELLLLETSATGARKRWSLTNLQEWLRLRLGAMISASSAKATPVDGDQLGIADSAAGSGTAKLTLLNLWANYLKSKADLVYSAAGHTHTKAAIGLGNVDNTSDVNKPVSTAQEIRTARTPSRTFAGTTDTLVATDAGGTVRSTGASSATLTVPPNASVAIPVDTYINLEQYGAGQLSIASGAGVTVRSFGSKFKLPGQYGAASLHKIGTDEWLVIGPMVA